MRRKLVRGIILPPPPLHLTATHKAGAHFQVAYMHHTPYLYLC